MKRRVQPGRAAVGSGPGAFPNFRYRGGPVIHTPQVFCVFLGDWTSAASQTRVTRINQFVVDMMNGDYMNLLAQYGCGSTGNLVNHVFIPSTDQILNRNDIESIFQTAVDNLTLPEPANASDVFLLFLDDSTGVDGTFGTDHIVMCEPTNDSAFGFHFHFTTTAGNALFYAVVPGLADACLTSSCPSDPNCSLHTAQTREQRQTQVLSHEFAEMISDPDVLDNEGWTSSSGPHENGDICNGQNGTLTVGPNSWNVQLMYSKYHDQQTNGATTCLVGSSFALPSLLPACSIILDRSTFGRDEVNAFLNGPNPQPAVFDDALYAVVDGFTATELGIGPGSFGNNPTVQPSFSLTPGVSGLVVTATSLSAPDQTQLDIIQRFTWVCQVTFNDVNSFPTTVGAQSTVMLTASLSTVSGSADLDLVNEPNPYELDGSTAWLSTDLRVFQIRANETRFGATMGSTPASGPAYIRSVIDNFNLGTTGGDTFDGILTDETDATLELSEKVNSVRVFNYALAKVRFRSLTADATSVRAFFRLFPASTTSTVYDQNTTYRRGGQSGVVIPKLGLVGGETTTIPCFAADRVDSSSLTVEAQADDKNVQTLTHDSNGGEVIAYFGCWLDINQPTQPQFPIAPQAPVDGPYASGRLTVQDLIRNAHQCLTMEISMDGATLVSNGDTPGSSDKLAQRNLSISASDNPGSPASHRVVSTFEFKPSLADQPKATMPDELLIDWGNTPAGSRATLYLPATDSADVLRLADGIYPKHRLSAVDGHTLECPAEGVTYVPVPPRGGTSYAGLLSVDLPSTVRYGEVYKVVVRQLTNASGRQVVPPPPIGSRKNGQRRNQSTPPVFASKNPQIHWRKVLGSFQLTIPVRKKEAILEPEERLLGVLRWIDKSIPASNRWSPVFDRYIGTIADRVRALGGDPDEIKPSPDGDQGREHRRETRVGFVGRVSELIFDRYGEFEGFELDTEDGSRKFRAREPDLSELLTEAWQKRILIRVIVEKGDERPLAIILLRPPHVPRLDGWS
jgi:hypothetical protein